MAGRSSHGRVANTPAPPARLLLLLLHMLVLLRLATAYAPLSDASLRAISGSGSATATDDLDPHSGALLAPLLMPRVPGTAGSARAQAHLAAFFAAQLPLWTAEWHNSSSATPATGARQVPFASLVLRRDPPWADGGGDVARLTLAAHYDSLYRPDGFVGATDSAAPCAVLMQVARGVDAALSRKWAAGRPGGEDGLEDVEDKGVQILFLDGEEAFATWSDTDSLYGARALAEAWESTPNPPSSLYPNRLSAISLFVLLDLLGDANPRVPSYFQNTHWAYQHLSEVEDRMRKLGVLETTPRTQFLPQKDKKAHQFTEGFIGDDHVPFMQRGVDILHIIPTPFPAFWHTMDDDAEHLDPPTIRDWAKIMTAFVAEWMELDSEMSTTSGETGRSDSGKDEL